MFFCFKLIEYVFDNAILVYKECLTMLLYTPRNMHITLFFGCKMNIYEMCILIFAH